MKITTRIILLISYYTNIDNFIAKLSSKYKLFKKAIPHPSFYKKTDAYTIRREKTNFCVNRSDYMQWSVYANLSDYSWLYAIDSIKYTNTPVIFDIGANIGAFTLKTATNAVHHTPGLEIHSFDPNPIIARSFLHNLSLNKGIEKNIKFNQCALADSIGQVHFNFSETNSGGGSIQSQGGILVHTDTLDNYCARNSITHVDFIKIDVEGYEPFVLKGGKQIINQFLPDMYIEVTPYLFKKNGMPVEEFFDFLFSLKYDIYSDERNLEKITSDNLSSFIDDAQFNILVKKPNQNIIHR